MNKKHYIEARNRGIQGEKYAQNYLFAQGYHVLMTNFHSKFGEIDIIAQKNNILIFFEVKTRSVNYTFGLPEESFTKTKFFRIKKTIYKFFEKFPKNTIQKWRIDLIAVTLNSFDEVKNIVHYKNVFE